MAGGHSAVGGAAVCRLDVPDPDTRFGQRGLHGNDAQGRAGHPLEPPKGMKADAGDAHVGHVMRTSVM